MKHSIYQMLAIVGLVVMVSLFASKEVGDDSITGKTYYDNQALRANTCDENHFDSGILFGGTIYHNYCARDPKNLRD